MNNLVLRPVWRVLLVLVGLASLWPGSARAQNGLTDKWTYRPISQAYGAAYSPDGSLIAVAGAGGVQMFSGATGALLRGMPTNASSALSVAFSPDGTTLAIGGFLAGNGTQTGVLELRTAATGALIASMNTTSTNVSCIAFSVDGTVLASGGGYGFVELWTVATHKRFKTLSSYENPVNAVAFSPDGKTLADAGYGETIDLWNYSQGTLTNQLLTQFIPIYSVSFSPDGATLADGGYGGVELWNVGAGTLTTTINLNEAAYSAAFSPDGSVLAEGGSNTSGGTLAIFSTTSGARLNKLATTTEQVRAVAFSPNGTTLSDAGTRAGAAGGGQLEQWGVAQGNRTSSTPMNFCAASVAFSPDGQTLAAGGGYGYGGGTIGDFEITPAFSSGGGVQLWSTSTGTLLATLATAAKRGVYSIAYSSDDSTLAVGGADTSGNGVLELWNAATGTIRRRLSTLAQPVNSVAISPDGTTLLVGGGGNSDASPGVLELWNIATGALISEIATSENDVVACVQFSPDGSTFVAGGSTGDPLSISEIYQFKFGQAALIASYVGDQVTCTAVAVTANAVYAAMCTPETPPTAEIVVLNAKTADVLDDIIGSNRNILGLIIVALYRGTISDCGATGDPTGSIEWVNPSGTIVRTVSSGGNGVVSMCLTQDNSLLAFSDLTSGIVVAVNPYYGTVPVSSLTISPAAVTGGTSATGTVTLAKVAPTGGDIVSLQSNSLSATPMGSITVPAGATSATFSVATTPVTATTTSTITASSGFASASAPLTINPPAIQTISLTPGAVIGGSTTVVTGTVTLNGPAPTGGAIVTLTSSNTAALKIPSSVTVAAGATSATFSATDLVVGTVTTVTVTAASNGGQASTTVTVNPLLVTALQIGHASVIGGASPAAKVSLNATVRYAVAVALSSSSPAVGPPATINVLANTSSIVFPMPTTPVAVSTSATITATLGASSQTANLTVLPAALSGFSVSPSSVQGSSSTVVTATITLSGPAPAGGTVISLASSDSAAAGVPTTITVAAGSKTATFTVTHATVTTQVVATLTATLGTATKTTTLTVTP